MRHVILDTHVNLSDMLDSKRNGGSVRLFQTKDELIDYKKVATSRRKKRTQAVC
ncbi:hypothetical protein LTR57_022546 [Friedmanniomyces endolithicus]|nr:hypothetical protein LTR57_022546 [Friedmanniomyces endolithicus]KAK0957741.1 hypothetical protein LTS01_022220 [Friedmanniomyces endolithicus]